MARCARWTALKCVAMAQIQSAPPLASPDCGWSLTTHPPTASETDSLLTYCQVASHLLPTLTSLTDCQLTLHYSLPTYYLLLLTYCSLLATRTPDCDICAMPIPTQVDWANLQRHNPDRIFDLAGTKRKYGVVEHAT